MKQFIKKHLDNYDCKTVADICSGTGDFAGLVAKDVKYIGFDLNQDFVNFARKRYYGDRNKQFIKADVLSKKFGNKTKYDAVMLISTIHHFSDDELETLLRTVKRITKRVVIIADIIPDPSSPIQKLFAKLDRGKHVRPGNEKIKLLNKYFKVIKTQTIPTKSAVQLGIICEKK